MGLPDKKAPTTSICLNTKKELTFSTRTIANTFKKHFENLASDLVNLECLQYASITRELTSVKKKQLKFEKVNSVSILKILKEFKTNKASGV